MTWRSYLALAETGARTAKYADPRLGTNPALTFGMTNTKQIKSSTEGKQSFRRRDGKFSIRQCGQCSSKNTVFHQDGDDKWCECNDCGFSTDLTNA